MSEERRDKFEALQNAFQKLLQNTSMLAVSVLPSPNLTSTLG